jgi:hypothetical protein
MKRFAYKQHWSQGAIDTLVLLDAQHNRFGIKGNLVQDGAPGFSPRAASKDTSLYKALEEAVRWLEEYGQSPSLPAINFICIIEFFSTTSAMHLMRIFQVLERWVRRGHIVTVEWYYYEDDEDMLDAAKDYERNRPGLPFKIIPIDADLKYEELVKFAESLLPSKDLPLN